MASRLGRTVRIWCRGFRYSCICLRRSESFVLGRWMMGCQRRQRLLMMWMWSRRGCPIWLGHSELLSGFCLSPGTSAPRALPWVSCYSLCVHVFVCSVCLVARKVREKEKRKFQTSKIYILDTLKAIELSLRLDFFFFFFESRILDFCSVLIVSCIFSANKHSICLNCHGICWLLFFWKFRSML